MKKGYHDYKPAIKIKKKEPKVYEKGSASLNIITTIPKPPIGYLVKDGIMIQTTDNKGNINVDSFVLMFGTLAPKSHPSKIYLNDLTAQASRILDK